MRGLVGILVVGLWGVGCGDDDAGSRDASAPADAATLDDAGTQDGAELDAAELDAAELDAAELDAAELDATLIDATPADATTANYTVSTAASNYVSETTTAFVFDDPDDGVASATIPFAFSLYDTPVSNLFVSVNGFAATSNLIGGAGTGSNVGFPTPAAPDGILAPWWDDLTADATIMGTVGQRLQGNAPNRVFIIQWQNVRVSSHSSTNNRRFNFQLALFETTNVIEYRYGETLTSGNPATATSASVGLEDPTGSIGLDVLGCSPNCVGPARPGNANGFPRQTRITLTPR